MCDQCGDCCRREFEDRWHDTPLTWDQKYHLLDLREKCPDETGCYMLVPDGEVFACLIQKEYGYDANTNIVKIQLTNP